MSFSSNLFVAAAAIGPPGLTSQLTLRLLTVLSAGEAAAAGRNYFRFLPSCRDNDGMANIFYLRLSLLIAGYNLIKYLLQSLAENHFNPEEF